MYEISLICFMGCMMNNKFINFSFLLACTSFSFSNVYAMEVPENSNFNSKSKICIETQEEISGYNNSSSVMPNGNALKAMSDKQSYENCASKDETIDINYAAKYLDKFMESLVTLTKDEEAIANEIFFRRLEGEDTTELEAALENFRTRK